ncbi:MAG: ABC transporter permease [Erysipelotrichaceae bacterium]|nr:ABC transporter permease [Erysipelotrichaceae bacterium]
MKKYLAKRIAFSIFSLFVVVMTVMLLVYTMIERSVIFQQDDTWNKKSNNDREMYEYVQYQKYGYLTYVDYSSFLKEKYTAKYGAGYETHDDFITDVEAIQDAKAAKKNASVKEFTEKYSAQGYEVKYMEPITYKRGGTKPGGKGYLIAIQEKNVFFRLIDYLKGFIKIETTNDVKDPELTDRYIRIEKDPYSGLFAVVGSGTTHKYLLYFDSSFPFIHQNWIRINLGTSYTTYRGQEITTVINNPTGDLVVSKQQYPSQIGTDNYTDTAIDFHTLTYNGGILSEIERSQFNDKYTVYSYKRSGLSMIGNSFVMGIIATIIAYALGLPLGMLMARRKDQLADKLGNAYIIFIGAVPSLAYIFMFAALGTTLFHLPYKFANAEVPILAYILPTISLSLPSIGSLMKWMRRYMIDQMNSDYVKFARSQGLSEKEIFDIHISRNAMIYLVHGIPANILGCLTGAIITERVYSVPGVGNLLTRAINSHDNGIIVACTVFYTSLSIISLILGDLLLTKYDPRISLQEDKGGGR